MDYSWFNKDRVVIGSRTGRAFKRRGEMKIDKELRDKLVGLAESMQTDDGLELCDPQSKFVEIGPRRLSLADQIKRVLRKEVERYAEHAEMESPEDAQDFDVPDDDPVPLSGFEHEEMVEDFVEQPLDEAVEAAKEKISSDPEKTEVAQDPGEPVPEVDAGPEEPGT